MVVENIKNKDMNYFFSDRFFLKKSLTKLPHGLKQYIRNVYNSIEKLYYFFDRKITKYMRKVYQKKYVHSYHFVVVTIKRTAYVDLAIKNINSLHCINPTHHVEIHCDDVCLAYLENNKHTFDYPQQVDFINMHEQAEKPWQYYKLRSIVRASKEGKILFDADGYWHDDPIIDMDYLMLLTCEPQKMEEKEGQKKLVHDILDKKPWGLYGHYVTGFVYIPDRLMIAGFEKHLFDIWTDIFDADLTSLGSEEELNIRRISEELAVNFALQSMYPEEKVNVLKEKDGLDHKYMLESFYYGCGKGILK